MNNLTVLEDAVKRKIKISWDDSETNKRVEEIVKAAIQTCNFKLGAHENEIDYEKEGQEQLLFLNYCMYEWYDRAEEFDGNYKQNILQLRQKYQVKHNREEDLSEKDE